MLNSLFIGGCELNEIYLVRTIYLTIFICSSFLFLIVNEGQAQLFSDKPLSPSKMCHKINKNRTKKFKKKFRLKKPVNDVSRISYKPYDGNYARANFKTKPASKEEIFSVPDLITAKKSKNPPSANLPDPVNKRHSEIREKVKEQIEKGNANEPIMESLYFISDEAEFAYVDFDPFLLAVEYALQGKMVLVEGFTDDRGGEEHNLQLSMKRVRQIEDLMHDIGVPPESVSVIGYGESMPKYDNSTEEGRQKNRRVDFKIF